MRDSILYACCGQELKDPWPTFTPHRVKGEDDEGREWTGARPHSTKIAYPMIDYAAATIARTKDNIEILGRKGRCRATENNNVQIM